jgi:maltose alpha-D-glucosyltransferase/alpha-amylase
MTLLETGTPATALLRDDPLWYKDAIIYQLHVKSFFDGNDDGIGDFAGLIAKLDYIVRLGVNTLWLLPFYPSPRRDDGYDIAAYEAVHPDYGTLEDASAFIEAAHARGLRVITELVINHTSDQHPWFQRARTAPRGSPERDFYVWSDDDQAYAGTRIIFCDTEKSNWTFDPLAGQYYWHRFYSHQPDLNFDNPAVLDAVLGVMHFWLRLGVDGLRLDAVPYLIEREGTSNENLPETHTILKRIRAEIDQHFPGCMLLAEANMWPEDTQQYFGDVRDGVGDECHMAFHFPLMPRMYMAIAREDRFPITDIMRQTPDIPFNCQWAIFLRNHDELTLEMVTDSERDYLWQTYAADRRARINLGIRRRLAPLLQRDRRRIELMTALLLTLPGTPVLYYGDEIGMGDNIHLGDRDGVRTPMQWSIDRNGGFSRADPAELVLPPIMDPLYGYATINVEAQERDQYSQLNWSRRVLEVRKRHQAFGRGTLDFLYPGNRKIMAYLREFEGSAILCVANLSRSLQAVELDLGKFETRVPIDIIGGASFPPIGKLPYLLTLPAYGFYAFQLASDAELPTWHVPAPEPLPEYRTLVLRGGEPLAGLLAEHRGVLEREILPAYLAKRRWYAEKDRRLESVSLRRLGRIDGLDAIELAELEVGFGDGGCARYQLPLGIFWEDANVGVLPQQLAIARVRQGRRVGHLTDAFALEGFARGIAQAFDANQSAERDGIRVDFASVQPIDISADAPINWLTAEQSNSSLTFGDRAMLKLLRRLRPGVQPESEFGRVLSAAGYANAPPLLGEIVATMADGDVITLGVLQGFVRNQGDAWRWALEYLHRAVDEWRVTESDQRRAELVAGYGDFAGKVGQRLGQLHALLAQAETPAFAAVAIDAARAGELARAVGDDVAQALAALRRTSPETLVAFLDAPERTEELLAVLAANAVGALETRIHGDFHLGQILVAGDDVSFVDFEGEPARPLEKRRAKASPLRDVAGFLRSLDYAAHFARRGGRDEMSVLEPDALADACLLTLYERAQQQFVSAYRDELERTPLAWLSPAQFDPMLRLFLIEKSAYEVCYEAANRPAWLPIPLAGLALNLDLGEDAA